MLTLSLFEQLRAVAVWIEDINQAIAIGTEQKQVFETMAFGVAHPRVVSRRPRPRTVNMGDTSSHPFPGGVCKLAFAASIGTGIARQRVQRLHISKSWLLHSKTRNEIVGRRESQSGWTEGSAQSVLFLTIASMTMPASTTAQITAGEIKARMKP